MTRETFTGRARNQAHSLGPRGDRSLPFAHSRLLFSYELSPSVRRVYMGRDFGQGRNAPVVAHPAHTIPELFLGLWELTVSAS